MAKILNILSIFHTKNIFDFFHGTQHYIQVKLSLIQVLNIFCSKTFLRDKELDIEYLKCWVHQPCAYILKARILTPTIPQKNLNFPQICPKMPQNGPKMAKNDPKWPKVAQI